MMDKPIPEWLQSGLVFASVAFVANAVNLYLIDLTGYLVAAAFISQKESPREAD